MKHGHLFHSSVLLCASYKDFCLALTFQNGKTVCYYDVPWNVYKELIDAKSPGKYYNTHIKSHFPSEAILMEDV